VALILKGVDGLLELVGGVLLLVVSPDTINRWAQRVTQHELTEDPRDFVALMRRERWAYPVAFVFLGGFVVYQLYRLTYDPSIGLALLTAFDVLIIWLTWREYRRTRDQSA